VARHGKRTIKGTDDLDISGDLRLYAQLGLRVPADIALRLKRYCQQSGKSANRAVVEALMQYLSANEK
jgi:hypothetical protein